MFTTSFLPFDMKMNKALLLLGNVLAGTAFIVLQSKDIFPLQTDLFLFFAFVLFLFALYRPGWTFLLFIGMLPFETIEFARFDGSLSLRPYQLLAVVLVFSLLCRMILKKLPFKLFRIEWFDFFPLIITAGAFAAALFSPFRGESLKQAFVVGSFVVLYFLGRVFFRTLPDIRQALPFLLSSSLVVICFSVWQNVNFIAGRESFEIMAGRPNATFTEADWLGLFILFTLTVIWALLLGRVNRYTMLMGFFKKAKSMVTDPFLWGVFLLETGAFIALLIVVSRSAWLGVLVGFIAVFGLVTFSRGASAKENFLQQSYWMGHMTLKSFILAFAIIWFFHLTTFDLFQRAASTAHGLQKITVSCERDVVLPYKIGNTNELPLYGCRHIDLEERDQERAAGRIVKEIYRDDPNVSIRKSTYGEVWKLVAFHPVSGIGWGTITNFLGTDERGAGLNASNMFLEVWLGSGFVGFLAFVAWWICIFIASIRGFFFSESVGEKAFAVFLIAGWAGMSVFNFFNSGILLSFFFVFLALGSLQIEREWRMLFKKSTL